MKKLLSSFILFSLFLVSCGGDTVFPLTRVEIHESGSKVSGIKDIWIGSTYTFTATFFNSKSQEMQVSNPEHILWTTNSPASANASFIPVSTGAVVSFIATAKPDGDSIYRIKVEYQSLTPYEINIQYKQ